MARNIQYTNRIGGGLGGVSASAMSNEQTSATKSDNPLEVVAAAGTLPQARSPLDGFLAEVEQRAFRIALYALQDEATAFDAVQDAMLKLVEKYAKRPAQEWPALFFTILSNRITDIRRWRRLREAGGRLVSLFRGSDDETTDLLEAGIGSELTPPDTRPESSLLGKQIGARIDQAISKLSDRQREVFLLREWQGFSVRETARMVGCSEGSVKQHHFRAMRALRAELAELWES